jgi:hydrogenase nickel incorporation protein HypA/HybF
VPVHEYALTQRIVAIVNETALAHGAKRVNAVHLVVGENTGIIPDSVQMYFDMIAEGTGAKGARLTVRSIRAEMRCPVCEQNFVRPRFSFACPVCGTLGSPTEIGNECYVESVELEA